MQSYRSILKRSHRKTSWLSGMHNIQYIAGGGASALLLAQLPRRSLSPPGYARLITLAGWRSAVSVRLTACYRCLLSQAQRSRSADLAVPAQARKARQQTMGQGRCSGAVRHSLAVWLHAATFARCACHSGAVRLHGATFPRCACPEAKRHWTCSLSGSHRWFKRQPAACCAPARPAHQMPSISMVAGSLEPRSSSASCSNEMAGKGRQQ